MITIKEYLLTKKTKGRHTIVANNDDELKEIVMKEIEDQGKNADLNHIDVSKVTSMSGLFKGTKFCGDVSEWDVSNLQRAYQTFYGLYDFNCDLSNWKLPSLESGYYMFYGCTNFDCDVSKWDLKELDNSRCMFQDCVKFKGIGIENWHMEKLKDAELMFSRCVIFNGNVSKWKIKNLERGRSMFLSCRNFDQDLGGWKTDKLYEGENMFAYCWKFKGKGLDKWNTKKLNSMSCMFQDCYELDVDLSSWKCESLDMSRIKQAFAGCSKMERQKKPFKWQ